MGKTYWAFAIFAILSVSSAYGQYGTIIQACSRDAASAGGTAECVEAHFPSFSTPCQAALVKIAAVREACKADIEGQCAAVKAGAGRILLCVKKHFSALSQSCKYALGEAAERNVGAR